MVRLSRLFGGHSPRETSFTRESSGDERRMARQNMMHSVHKRSVLEIVENGNGSRVGLTADDVARMKESESILGAILRTGRPIYGLTRGFGPLVEYQADTNSEVQGTNLILHLAAGQGAPLSPDVTRLMLRLRLEGMKLGYSGISVEDWEKLAYAYNSGFTPVVPSKGSVSASGDLIPLAHAALALSGEGEAWMTVDGQHQRVAASAALKKLGVPLMRWKARDALAFVNGSSASLAVVLYNHVSLLTLSYVACHLTGKLVQLLGCCTEPYEPVVVAARGSSAGHEQASRWIRDELGVQRPASDARSVQEPYSLRCAAQIVGAVLDQLGAAEKPLVREASSCSDNPVISGEGVFHGGNFHALEIGLIADMQAVLAHQLAFLAERQLSIVVEPNLNGGLPALLASRPGSTSGLAGVQIAASAFVSEIRLKAGAATTTALPTNLANQDVVPMSLVGALRTAETLGLVELTLASLAVAVAQLYQAQGKSGLDPIWSEIVDKCPRLEGDRSFAAEVRDVRDIILSKTLTFNKIRSANLH